MWVLPRLCSGFSVWGRWTVKGSGRAVVGWTVAGVRGCRRSGLLGGGLPRGQLHRRARELVYQSVLQWDVHEHARSEVLMKLKLLAP